MRSAEKGQLRGRTSTISSSIGDELRLRLRDFLDWWWASDDGRPAFEYCVPEPTSLAPSPPKSGELKTHARRESPAGTWPFCARRPDIDPGIPS